MMYGRDRNVKKQPANTWQPYQAGAKTSAKNGLKRALASLFNSNSRRTHRHIPVLVVSAALCRCKHDDDGQIILRITLTASEHDSELHA